MIGENMLERSPEVKSEAKQRGARTLLQGAIATVLVAVLPVLYAAFSAGVDTINWETLKISALTAGSTALISFAMNWVKPVDNAE